MNETRKWKFMIKVLWRYSDGNDAQVPPFQNVTLLLKVKD
jgi:hypothetical protein